MLHTFLLGKNQQQSGIIIQIYCGVTAIACICDNMKKWLRAHLALSGTRQSWATVFKNSVADKGFKRRPT